MASNKSRKRRKIIIFAVIFLVLVALSLVAIFRKREAAITVQTEKAGRRNLTEMVVANGKIQPVLQVVICPEVSGEIVELIKEGQRVQKGGVLVKIKPVNYTALRTSAEATYQSALAAKAQAQATLTRADLDYQRADKLSQSQLISESQLLEAKTTWEVAKACLESCGHQIEQAKAVLAKADDDLSKTTIYAPMTGTVTKLKSQVGERVVGTAMMAGTEILTVANLEEMEARVDIGEVDVILIAVGQTAHLEVDAFRDRKFNGIVTEIANSSKSSGPTSSQPQQDATKFEVKIRVQEKEMFRPGMSVTAEIETRSRTNVLAVPIQSVTTRRNKNGEKGKKGSGSNSVAAASASNLAGKAIAGKSTATNVAGSTNTACSNATAQASAKGNSNAPSSTNLFSTADTKKGDTNKVTECVFVLEGDHVKLVPVKHGISDEAYMEITEGLEEGTEIITGGYKAINRDLEDGKKVKKGTPEKEEENK